MKRYLIYVLIVGGFAYLAVNHTSKVVMTRVVALQQST